MTSGIVRTSVVICAHTMERYDDLQQAIASVQDQTLQPLEVIVAVDHNELLVKRLEEPSPGGVRISQNSGIKGLSATRNAGVKSTNGDVVAFIDDDAIADREWLASLVDHFANSRVAAVGGRIVPAWPDRVRPDWLAPEFDWIVGCTYQGQPLRNGNQVRNVTGCNMAFRRAILDRVGLFREDWGRGGAAHGEDEETELCLRIRLQAPETVILHEPRAIVHHKVPPGRLTLRFLIARSYREGFSKGRMRKLFPKSYRDTRSTESAYLRHLLFRFGRDRVTHLYRSHYAIQMAVGLLCIAATGVGALRGSGFDSDD